MVFVQDIVVMSDIPVHRLATNREAAQSHAVGVKDPLFRIASSSQVSKRIEILLFRSSTISCRCLFCSLRPSFDSEIASNMG